MEIKMKRIFVMLLLGLLGYLGSSLAYAQSDLAKIQSTGVIRIGTEGTYAPFTYHDPSGLTGFDVDIARAIAQRLGVNAKFIEGKWDGLIAGLDAGRYDAVINQVDITAARKAKYDFSDPYISSQIVLIVRSDNTSINAFDDLKGKPTATTLTSNFGKLAQKYGAQVVAVQDFNEAIELLLSGRVEAVINDKLSFRDFKKHKPNAKVKIVASDKSMEFSKSGVLVRKNNPQLVMAIDKALANMKADGTYTKIFEKYFGKDLSIRH
jgi:cystine transport system substrate-binding protein